MTEPTDLARYQSHEVVFQGSMDLMNLSPESKIVKNLFEARRATLQTEAKRVQFRAGLGIATS